MMKKFFSFFAVLVFAMVFTSLAQSAQKLPLTFGGIENGSMVSVMQFLDYPMLLLADKNDKVKSYEITVLQNANQNNITSYKIEGAKLSNAAINELKAAAGKNGKIFIDNIVVIHNNIEQKVSNMVFHFEQ